MVYDCKIVIWQLINVHTIQILAILEQIENITAVNVNKSTKSKNVLHFLGFNTIIVLLKKARRLRF